MLRTLWQGVNILTGRNKTEELKDRVRPFNTEGYMFQVGCKIHTTGSNIFNTAND